MPTVAIVSNLPRLVDLAEQVDACDEVIRFSHCWGWGTWTGKKTTRWVGRTEANERADEVFDQCSQLNEILPTIETAHVLYGMRLRGNWTEFKAERLLREHPYLDRKVAPIDCRPFCETTPGCYPTSGTAFLDHVLRAKLFPSWRRLLVNWDYAVICGHDFEYEKTLVNRWISEGHFQHIDKERTLAVLKKG